MISKSIFIIISFICGIKAISTFIDKGIRPKLFELTDNEVAILRVTIPQEDVDIMKNSLNKGINTLTTLSMKEALQNHKLLVSNLIDGLLRMNYTLLSPEYPLKNMIPQLKIGYDGMSQLNKEEILKEFHFEPEYYIKIKSRNEVINEVMQSNPNFDIKTMIITFMSLNLIESQYMDPVIVQSVKKELEQNDIDYKTKNSTLVFEINNEKKIFDKITFSVGGVSSLEANKPGYNIKIRGDDDLFGRTHIKLRSDNIEPTYLRTKLLSDIHNVLGLKSLSSNFAILYINDEYFGLYIMSDKYKTSWIEKVYGEKKTKSLYKCESNLEADYIYNYFKNENDDITDLTEINELLVKFDEAQSAADIENIFEVDHFLNEIALEYLTGSWDNFNNANNYYLYKQPNGKWIYLTYDYDNSFGANLDSFYCGFIYTDFPERMNQCVNNDYPNNSIKEYFKPVYRDNVWHIIDILVLKDSSRFVQILSNIVEKVFNPANLYPRIDELKEFIKPYVKKEKIRNDKGIYPGGYNLKTKFINSYEEWEANSEFTKVNTLWGHNAYGIKYWILAKYRNVCETYSLECDPIYMDKNYKFPIDKKVEFKGYGISETQLLSNTSISTNTTRKCFNYFHN